mmetsp:Transcript_16769/g.25839  ORF Transcript_16769/g.25839 Transcript_16769/m.25839 type:complete len:197 (+) Transcript_16769:222-812(+)
MQHHKYCSLNLDSGAFKVFTCPMENCPAGNSLVSQNHTKINEIVHSSAKWSANERGYNCKVQISASPLVNGKLNVKVESVHGQMKLYVYMQPNHFNSKVKQTYGVEENGMAYQVSSYPRTFKVPSDWSVFFVYINTEEQGSLGIESWVEEFTPNDKEWLEEMAPTGCKPITQAEHTAALRQQAAEQGKEALDQAKI